MAAGLDQRIATRAARNGPMNQFGGASWRPVWSFVGLLVAYYAFPVDWNGSGTATTISLLLTGAGLALLAWMLGLELVHRRAGRAGLTPRVLTMALIMLIMSFSLVFFLVDQLAPNQISGLNTRTDALYFTLSTMTTVGFGDVYAAGQVARILVCGLIVFNIVVVTTLLRFYTGPDRPRRQE